MKHEVICKIKIKQFSATVQSETVYKNRKLVELGSIVSLMVVIAELLRVIASNITQTMRVITRNDIKNNKKSLSHGFSVI